MNRIEARMKQCRERQKQVKMVSLMAGVPDILGTKEALRELARDGCDVVELGIPFSDPAASISRKLLR